LAIIFVEKIKVMFIIQKKVNSKINGTSVVNVSQMDEVLEFETINDAENFLKNVNKKFTCEFKIKKV